jgi:hypothetical protein
MSIMNKKKVPKKIIDSLFESGDAVPEKDSFPKS